MKAICVMCNLKKGIKARKLCWHCYSVAKVQVDSGVSWKDAIDQSSTDLVRKDSISIKFTSIFLDDNPLVPQAVIEHEHSDRPYNRETNSQASLLDWGIYPVHGVGKDQSWHHFVTNLVEGWWE